MGLTHNLLAGAIRPIGVSRQEDTTMLVGMAGTGKSAVLATYALDLSNETFHKRHQIYLVKAKGRPIAAAKIRSARFSSVLATDLLCFNVAGAASDRLQIAVNEIGSDFSIWETVKTTTPLVGSGLIVPEFKHNSGYVLYHGAGDIKAKFSRDLKIWHGPDKPLLDARHNFFDNHPLELIAAHVVQPGILVLYGSTGTNKQAQVGAALFASHDPARQLWRAELPLWSAPAGATIIGAYVSDEQIVFWCTSKTEALFQVAINNPFAPHPASANGFLLTRFRGNPMLGPRNNGWENVGVFNPATLDDGKTVHMLYRALNYDGMSYIGYASSEDGFTIDRRSPEPVYWPRAEFEGAGSAVPTDYIPDKYASGGGWGGCEDPKISLVDGRVYLTYVGHNGWNHPRIAMSSIDYEDFVAHRWDQWTWPKLISEPGVINKSGVVLPEKINGKYVVFHRVFPNILIHFSDNLEFGEDDRWLRADAHIPVRPDEWDSRKISIGATPIKIKEGWLVIYHAVDDRDSGRYKIGAMILDHHDPSKVLYRSNAPLLSPEADYENDWKFGIAYPSGATIRDGQLIVYYGGGDKYVCAAHTDLATFIQDLKTNKPHRISTNVTKIAG